MKLAETIDLFHRRLRFRAKDDLVNFACVEITGDNICYYVNVDDSCDTGKLQAVYYRTFQDMPNVSIKVIPTSRWVNRKNIHVVWTRRDLAAAPPKD